VITELPAVRDDWSVSPEGDRLALPTDITDQPKLLVVDLSTGDVSDIGPIAGGNGAVSLGPDGRVAACVESLPVGVLQMGHWKRRGEWIQVDVPVGPGCPTVVWRDDDTFALRSWARDSTFEAPKVEIRYGTDPATLRSIPLPQEVRSRGDISWSADGASLVFTGFGNRVWSVDVATGAARDIGPGYRVSFAPRSPDLIAVNDHSGREFYVLQDGEKVAGFAMRPGQSIYYDWCPGERWIAFADQNHLWLWDWRSDESKVIKEIEIFDGQSIGDDVSCLE
jgi:Tol biopolymer transport system component